MIRFAWLQNRTQTFVLGAGLLAVAILTAVSGPHQVHLYNAFVRGCGARGDCEQSVNAFIQAAGTSLRSWLGIIVIAVPGIIGIFWGAPLVAREFESGTQKLVWTQSVSRTRWLAVKLGLLGLISMTITGLLSLAVTWWASPLDAARSNVFDTFDMRDLAPIGYAALAFVIGVAAGALIRRTVPAMAASLAAFVGARFAFALLIRPHLAGAKHAVRSIADASRLGMIQSPAGITFRVDRPGIANAWVLSSNLVDTSGHVATDQTMHAFLQAHCQSMLAQIGAGPSVADLGARKAALQQCVSQVSATYHLALTYQPGSRYWLFQWYELGIFLAGALALAAGCFWWLRRRHA